MGAPVSNICEVLDRRDWPPLQAPFSSMSEQQDMSDRSPLQKAAAASQVDNLSVCGFNTPALVAKARDIAEVAAGARPQESNSRPVPVVGLPTQSMQTARTGMSVP